MLSSFPVKFLWFTVNFYWELYWFSCEISLIYDLVELSSLILTGTLTGFPVKFLWLSCKTFHNFSKITPLKVLIVPSKAQMPHCPVGQPLFKRLPRWRNLDSVIARVEIAAPEWKAKRLSRFGRLSHKGSRKCKTATPAATQCCELRHQRSAVYRAARRRAGAASHSLWPSVCAARAPLSLWEKKWDWGFNYFGRRFFLDPSRNGKMPGLGNVP